MRVMVTGGTGFAGSHATAALVRAGHDVRLLVRNEEKLRRTFEPHEFEVKDFVLGDMTEQASVEEAMEGCEAVLHTAALVSMGSERADEVTRSNLRGTELVIGGAAERGIERILYLSSLGALFHPRATDIRANSDVVESRNPYTRSKANAELYVRRLQRDGAPITTVFPSAILGPDDPALSEAMKGIGTFVNTCILRSAGGYLSVDVRDLAGVQLRLLEEGRRGGFIAAGHFLAWPQLGDLLDSITGHRVRRLPGPGWLMRAAGRVGDLAKRVVTFELPLTYEGMCFATQMPPIQDSPELAELGIRFRDPLETYTDALRWLVSAGHLTAGCAPKLTAAG
ncbi:MAG: NAD-dependent epimerase/dehydratase family protein [Deltaproteobacteria bacterium]|nr:NAD-dependent epimerase/dehydratase family protein [Deltaproteobacteria bacterium]MBW2421080.1 NAD-dependent epimerase/dehydratase family protein [Deltaproteobacteria bacterium]